MALAAVLVLAVVAPAHGDGDPASDTLVSEAVFFPYSPPVSKPYGPALTDLLERADKLGYTVKVALIQTPADLGAYPQMFNNMQQYADLLYSELPTPKTAQHGVRSDELVRLLVVMPAGFGGNNLGEGVDDALSPIEIDTEAQSDGLARAALEAVARLATANGFDLPVPPEATAKPADAEKYDGGGVSPVVFVAPLVLVILGAGLAGRLARRRSEE
ncbi:MAG TPA: hypothetical protein VM347_35420, partial [Nonomuraea sp.]|nr:hypothetical protein [Nonomuraea sp.]